MLDILANNNWKQALYFTGGANAAEEYIWLKDYLQLDGLAYKFVPIRTPNENGIFELGRIDSEALYKTIKNWSWDKIDNNRIYLDVESRKNSISFRNNMFRLAKQLIEEKKDPRAEEILDMSLEKMPIEKYGHYGICLSYPEFYYRLGKVEKARNVSEKLMRIFQEKLSHYAAFDAYYLDAIFEGIERNLNMYRSVLSDAERFEEDETYLTNIQSEFLATIQQFEYLME
jgi:hypothetical protein